MIIVISTLIIVYYLFTNRRYRWFYIMFKTVKRDFRALVRFSKLNFVLRNYERNNSTVCKIFSKNAAKNPAKTAFLFEDASWTFQQVEELSNQISHFFKEEGFKKGDVIAILMESRPEYVCIWLGLSKLGVISALINTNLVSSPLLHSLNVADVKAIVYGKDFVDAIRNISPSIAKLKLFQYNDTMTEILPNSVDLKEKLQDQPLSPLREEIEMGTPRDKLLFIYTSGTTGLPKAAVITNMRYLFMAIGLHFMAALRKEDILYDPLPLYHSAGGIVGVGQCLLHGLTVAIRKKFSASNFWTDCIKYKCSAAQYIGETCRYILAAHTNKSPIEHDVRVMLGNGLRPQIWTQFVNCFKIKEIYEFYGATEGNSNLVNIDNKAGAVGFVPRYTRGIYPVTLVKCNEVTGEPIRNKKGFCIPCEIDEPGVFIGKINPRKSVNDFSGYADKKATESKVIENVFKKGDFYFNSGDILVQDELGYYYFKDRTGDTFRWKGENVATSEVEAVVSNVVNYKDAVVYGVSVSEMEGKAGMVAIVDTEDSLNIDELWTQLKAHLPAYAIPVFVRVMKSVPLTGTFKLKKRDLQEDGFDVRKIKDHLYVNSGKKYVQLTQELYNDINNGKFRL